MPDTEIMNEIIKLEFRINKVSALSSNKETVTSMVCRERIEFLKDKLKATV